MRKVYGLTGGIASGKSTVANMFKEAGYHVIDCDKIVAELYNTNELKDKIRKAFGETIFDEQGNVDKTVLAKDIFANRDKSKILTDIIHPLVFNEIDRQKETSINKDIIVDMPLLFEVGYKDYDKVICVYANLEKRIERLMKRDNISSEYAMLKINSQLSLDKKKEQSDFVLDNSNTIEDTKGQFFELLKQL